MLQKYQNFIDRHGKIIFPIYFLSLFLLFIIPSFYCVSTDDVPQHLEIAKTYTVSFVAYFYKSIATPFGVFPILSIICALIFLCLFFIKKRTIKWLLVLVPAFYLCQIIILGILSIDDKVIRYIPFISFYLVLALFVMTVLYCVKTKEVPDKTKKPHELTQTEQIAELEKQVADSQARVDTNNNDEDNV